MGKKNKNKPQKSDILKPASEQNNTIQSDLQDIYQNKKGEMPDLTHLETGRKKRIIKILVFSLLSLILIALVSWWGFFVFQPKPSFSGEGVNIEIKAPFTSYSGQLTDFIVNYSNLEDVSLTNSKIAVYLPENLIIEQTKPEHFTDPDTPRLITWDLNKIYPGQTGDIYIQGYLINTVPSQEQIQATLEYIPETFNSKFEETASFTTSINQSILETEVQGPKQLANSEEGIFDIILKNSDEKSTLTNIKIELLEPQNFEFTSYYLEIDEEDEDNLTDEQTDEESQEIMTEDSEKEIEWLEFSESENEEPTSKEWIVEKILPDKTASIHFKGKFEIDENAESEFKINSYLKGNEDNFFKQKENLYAVNVIKGDLMANLFVQGSLNNKAISFGDTLTFLLSLQNKSENTLGEIEVRLVLDSLILNWDEINNKNEGIVSVNQVLWTREQVQKLSILLPEDEANIELQIPVKTYDQLKKYSLDDYKVTSYYEVKIKKLNNVESQSLIKSNTIVNELNSNTSISATARYFNDDNQSIGNGPLPPVVGETTSYKIYWQISNNLHDLHDLKIVTTLPEKITWHNNHKSDSGELKSENNQIIWEINRLPASVETLNAEFEVSLTPTSDDEKKILTLLSETILTAIDSETSGEIIQTSPAMTTNLDDDPNGKGKGLIQPAE